MAQSQAAPKTPRAPTGKEILLAQAGAMKDDQEDLAELRAEIYKERGRSETERL